MISVRQHDGYWNDGNSEWNTTTITLNGDVVTSETETHLEGQMSEGGWHTERYKLSSWGFRPCDEAAVSAVLKPLIDEFVKFSIAGARVNGICRSPKQHYFLFGRIQKARELCKGTDGCLMDTGGELTLSYNFILSGWCYTIKMDNPRRRGSGASWSISRINLSEGRE